jgi:hypothetical protein
MSQRGPSTLSEHELALLDAAVEAALESGDDSSLTVLGYGEVSCVVAWGGFACKRLPPFPDARAVEAYRVVLDDYLAILTERGVRPVRTELRHRPREGGGLSVFCLQPILEPEALGPHRLRAESPAGREALLHAVLGAAFGCVDDEVGLDGQLSNWAWSEGELAYLDVTTPLLRDESGGERLDTELFLASLPWLMRPAVRRFALPEILGRYRRPRDVAVDFVANLLKEQLDDCVELALDVANDELAARSDSVAPVTRREVDAYYRSDARMWGILQWLRRVDRSYQRRVRGRVYPFLLPGNIRR